jgi:hypothetical protein
MKLVRSFTLLIVITVAIASCDGPKKLIGKWKVISVNVKKNRILEPSNVLVFDPEGYVMFNDGKAARGNWEMVASNNTISLFLYGKALQHDLQIVGEYDFSSNKLTITDPKNEERIFLELERIEEEPPK